MMGKKATYKPTDGEVNGPSYRAILSREAVEGVVMRFKQLGEVQLSKATLATRYAVYGHIMDLCNTTKRGRHARAQLEQQDDELHMDMDSWGYILNELLEAGVQLPIVQECEVGRD